jgi:uncharacterized ferritin-like protein (DUF455 family)
LTGRLSIGWNGSNTTLSLTLIKSCLARAVAQEEALHFTLVRDHLASLGYAYGDFPAHNALWEMAERTRDDVLARMALVPRTLEARGLDASPPMKAKFLAAGDVAAAGILDAEGQISNWQGTLWDLSEHPDLGS